MSAKSNIDDIYAETLRVFLKRDSAGPLTTPEVAESLDCGRRAAHKRLQTLADHGELRTKKVGAGARVWWRDPSDDGAADAGWLRDLLTNAERLADVGAWEYDTETETLFWTEGACRIHGVDSDYEPTVESALQFYHPDDRPVVTRLLETCIETGAPYSIERRIITEAGEERWVRVSAEALTEDGREIVRGFIQDITAQKSRARVLENQHEQLAALNSLNNVVRRLTDAVLDQSTRIEIEETTCEQLSASDSYEFAWIATVDPVTLELVPRVERGVDGYLEDAALSANPTEPDGRGPAGRAVRTKEMQFSRDVFDDESFEFRLDLAETYGYRSLAIIPIVYEETLYGVIGIYSGRVGAFADAERKVLSGIGEVVGHAIAAVEHKQALLSDNIVELSFRIDNSEAGIELPGSFEASFDFDSTLALDDGVFLVYCTTDLDGEDMQQLAENARIRYVDDVTVLGEEPDGLHLEIRFVDPPILSTTIDYGGYVSNVTLTNGSMTITVHMAAERDVSGAVDRITSSASGAEMLRRHQTTRPHRSLGGILQTLPESLTERQQAALEAAYFTGYFNWPREHSGPEVADRLGVNPSTFHQHLRKAERKLLDGVFS